MDADGVMVIRRRVDGNAESLIDSRAYEMAVRPTSDRLSSNHLAAERDDEQTPYDGSKDRFDRQRH